MLRQVQSSRGSVKTPLVANTLYLLTLWAIKCVHAVHVNSQRQQHPGWTSLCHILTTESITAVAIDSKREGEREREIQRASGEVTGASTSSSENTTHAWNKRKFGVSDERRR